MECDFMEINWYKCTHETLGTTMWSLFCTAIGVDGARAPAEHGEIIKVSDSDYRWMHRLVGSSNRVRGETLTLKDAVDAVERQLTTLNGHQRIALVDVREAAGLPC